MLEARGGADLAQEALTAEGGAEVGVQHLDGDVAVVADVMRQVHGGHATLPKLALDAVATAKGGAEPFERFAH
jgi:hypothetical protein